MTKIIAIFNQAGGVMKTSLTMNLGYHLSRKHKVLLVDTDPQASLTTFMGLEPHELEEIVADSLLTPETKLPIHHKAFADAVMNSQPLAVYDPKHPAIAKRSVGIAVLKKIALGMEKL